jgi:S-DNA-T family DNA segregation ATPase FtsK/SpoIIIE
MVAFFSNERTHFVAGILLLLASVYLLFAFISFFFTGDADQSLLGNISMLQLRTVTGEIQNWTGVRGAYFANLFINKWFGISSFAVFIFLFPLSMQLMRVRRKYPLIKLFFYTAILLIWGSLSFGFFFIDGLRDSFLFLGGAHGYYMSLWLNENIGVPGTFLLIVAILLVFLIFTNKKTMLFLRKILSTQLPSLNWKKYMARNEDDDDDEDDDDEDEDDRDDEENSKTTNREIEAQKVTPTLGEHDALYRKEAHEDVTLTLPGRRKHDNFEVVIPYSDDMDSVEIHDAGKTGNKDEDEDYNMLLELGEYDPTLDLSHYQFPPISLLKRYESAVSPEQIREEQNANKNRIIETLGHYGIGITSVKATVGPTITLYEIIPEPGVKISKIRNLEDDIALSLAALGIRIIAPIPGKGTIGIEVPNKDPQTVSMQSVIASKKFQDSSFDLPIALGKTITNDIFMVDLCKMPHILVAGATGQGKSVGLNAIITSLLYKKHPSQLKLVLVDPKKVEFNIYASIERHFLAKLPDGEDAIITDVTKVVQTLKSLTIEMDSRYDLLKKAHVRNAKEYNSKFVNRRLNPEKGHRFLPYIVVIIDEFGDLIMTAGKEVELPIARIAQLARAVGIHMIIATQRPSVNIITGVIKANFPARVAFKVSQANDSRIILDTKGANQLIGRGDLLFSQGSSDLIRVQCAFVDTPEVEDVANYVGKQQAYPTAYYLPEYVPEGGETESDIDMSKLDPLFPEVARLIVVDQLGSTSLIQRKFSIGYARSGRIMDQLEKAGIVGPNAGSKPRKVLIDDEYHLEQLLSGM